MGSTPNPNPNPNPHNPNPNPNPTDTMTETATIMPCERAETLAEILNAEETDGWRYVVKPTTAHRARVAVYDETDRLLGYL